MSDDTEQRTTRDGLPVDRPTTRIDALRPLVDAVRGLEQRTDRIVEQIEANRARTEQRRRAERAERDKALVEMVDEAFQKIGRRTSACRFYTEHDEGFPFHD